MNWPRCVALPASVLHRVAQRNREFDTCRRGHNAGYVRISVTAQESRRLRIMLRIGSPMPAKTRGAVFGRKPELTSYQRRREALERRACGESIVEIAQANDPTIISPICVVVRTDTVAVMTAIRRRD